MNIFLTFLRIPHGTEEIESNIHVQRARKAASKTGNEETTAPRSVKEPRMVLLDWSDDIA